MWECRKCREQLDEQFEACWNCGTARGQTVSEISRPEDTDTTELEAEALKRTQSEPPQPKSIRSRVIKVAISIVLLTALAEWTGLLGWCLRTWKPFPQQRAVAAIRDAGGSVDTYWHPARGPYWRRFLELPKIYGVVLKGSGFDDDQLQLLEPLQDIKQISIWQTFITNDGLARLSELHELREVQLWSNPAITEDGIAHLVNLRDLELLRLGIGIRITDNGLHEIVSIMRDRGAQVMLHDIVTIDPDKRAHQFLSLGRTRISTDGIGSLAAVPNLRAIALEPSQIDDDTIRVLAEVIRNGQLSILQLQYELQQHVNSDSLLQTLDLEKARITDLGLAHIAGASELRHLDIRGTKVTPAGFRHLEGLENLRVVFADPEQLGDEAVQAYTAGKFSIITWSSAAWFAPNWSSRADGALGTLQLARSAVTDAGLAHLRNAHDLESLSLTNTAITDKGVEHLRGCSGLKELHLGGTAMTDSSVGVLASLSNMHTLSLGSAITDAGVEELAGLTELRSLSLRGAQVTDDGLATISNCANLESLDLRSTMITDEGLSHLVDLPLETLRLSGTQIGDDGIKEIVKLDGLRTIGLPSARVTGEGIQLLESLPELRNLFLSPRREYRAAADSLRRRHPQIQLMPASSWESAEKNWNRDSLVGQRAPDFALPQLHGEEFRLSDHLGKDIIILDFWARWCGPCVTALPDLMAIAEEYADEGVVLYGVTCWEGKRADRGRNAFESDEELAQAIEAFVTARGWDLNVLLDRFGGFEGRWVGLGDSDGGVAKLFHVDAIPQTVLIGRDGTVEFIHRGARPGLKQQLAKEIEVLLTSDTDG